MWQFLTDAAAKVRGQHRPARQRVRRPLSVEWLEERVVLSPVPLGPEFRVNTTTAGDQAVDRVALDADGDSVVVWTTQQADALGQVTDLDVYAQRYTATGLPAGGEFRVNSNLVGLNWDADVAMEADGDFVVVWFRQSLGRSLGIFAQRYSRTGVALGTEFPVTSVVDGSEASPAIAVADSGAFVVIWSEGTGTSAIVGQRFSAQGDPQGGEFVVVQSAVFLERPRIAMAPGGHFVVIWGTFEEVFGQRFSRFGVAQGASFLVPTTGNGALKPDLAMDGRGNFVVVWKSNVPEFGVLAQRYSAAGVRLGSEFRVNTNPVRHPNPAVAMNRNGAFVVVWDWGFGISGQRYTAAGLRAGGEFPVNSATAGHRAFVAMDALGRLLVSWSGGDFSDRAGVFARRYGVPETTFVFFFLGFCGQVGEDPPSGMETLRATITADPDLVGAVVAAPPLGWPDLPGPLCQLTPFVVRRQMAAARLQVRQFLGHHQYDQRSDRVVLIGHSYGGNIAYELAVERAAGRRRQKPDPVEGLVTLDPIDWKLCRFQLINICVQSQHERPAPRDVPLDNILNFVQRNPRIATPLPTTQALQGFTITGAMNDDLRGRGQDGRWGTLLSPSPDDTRHDWVDDDFGPGSDGRPGGGDDVSLGIFDVILGFLRRLVMT